jgi:hypothetical protein
VATAHASESHDDQLELIVSILADEFERAVFGATSQWRRSALLLAIILFGSHAADGPATPSPSRELLDRQILVVVSDERLADIHRYWLGAEGRLQRAHAILGTLSAPTNLMVRSISHVNGQLDKGRPFFTKIIQKGVRLYEAPACSFSRPRSRSPNAVFEEARGHFDQWMGAAERRMKIFAAEMVEAQHDPVWRRDAAFTLHQAVERLYGCLLALEGHSRAIHQIGTLRSLAEQVDPRLVDAWPRETKKQRRAFELLRQAYIRGRYAPDFCITQHELDWLVDRAEVLRRLVRQACEGFLLSAEGDGDLDQPPVADPAHPPEAARGGCAGGEGRG